MTHEEMITLIGNTFIDAYVAGDRKDLDSFRPARADRDRLFDEVRNLYAELEHESYEREQFESELKEADETIKTQQVAIAHMLDVKDRLQVQLNNATKEIQHLKEQLYCQADIENCMDVFDDAGKFSEQDLPFPDVEDLADTSDVEGSEE